ncbi:hypothetical protein ACS0PU_002248 [Formica fusca]
MATREQIQEYLYIRDNIDMTVNAVLNKIVSIDTIPEGEEKNMIELTVETVEKKKEYMHEKVSYEAAIYDYRVTEHSNPKALRKIAAEYGLDPMDLSMEIYKTTTDSNYVFTKAIEGENISYADEEELWKHLKSFVERNSIPCSCRACFLLESSIQAYKFCERWNIDNFYQHGFLALWDLHKAATIEWIKKFEMRHRDEIYNLCSKSCNKTCSVAPVVPVCSTSMSNK